MIVSVGIDVAKEKHDCFILNSESTVLANVFTNSNSMEGFNTLLEKIRGCTTPQDNIKVWLEATGQQRSHLSCSQEAGTPYFRHGEIQTAISLSGINSTT